MDISKLMLHGKVDILCKETRMMSIMVDDKIYMALNAYDGLFFIILWDDLKTFLKKLAYMYV
jgi:hypothetical protein